MDKIKELNKIFTFLKKNEWVEDTQQKDEYHSFFHKYNYGIDICKENGEIVVIAEEGDIFHIQLSHQNIYTLVGFLVINPCDDICLRYKF